MTAQITTRPQRAAPAARWPALRLAHRRFVGLFVVSSSTGTSLAYLDGIRGVAVVLVVLLHAWIRSGAPSAAVALPVVGGRFDFAPFFKTGYVGVDLFFVLSGFLLSQYWLRADWAGAPRPSTRRYLRNRVFRIVPAYYFCLFLMLLLLTPALIPPELVYSSTGLFILGAHLTFTQFLFPLSAASYSINGPLWTLTMEMTFYLLLPWAVRLFLRNRWLVTLPALTLATLGWLWLARHSLGPLVQFWQGTVARYGVDEATIRYFLSKQFPAHFVDFGLGIALANISTRIVARPPTGRLARAAIGTWAGASYFVMGTLLVLFMMLKLSGGQGWWAYYLSQIPVALGFTLMLAGLIFGGRRLQALFGFTPLRLIGLVGFSAYLWHMPIISLLEQFPGVAALPTPERFQYVLARAAPLVLLVSIVFFLAIEKPFMQIGRRPATLPDAAPERPPTAPPVPLATRAAEG